MDNQNLFNELFHKLTIERQKELISILKNMSKEQPGKTEQKDSPDFNHVDYRDLYFALFYEVGKHIDGLVSVLHKLEDIHLQPPQTGQIIGLSQCREDE